MPSEDKQTLSHIDEKGQAKMVDVGQKAPSQRSALARCEVILPQVILDCFSDGEIQTKKGAVFHTATIAGIMGAKKTHDLIPMCHPLGIEKCKIDIQLNENRIVVITAEVGVFHKTGVEMEALTACSIAALTIYDMCKALSHDIVISSIRLIQKKGGKSDVLL